LIPDGAWENGLEAAFERVTIPYKHLEMATTVCADIPGSLDFLMANTVTPEAEPPSYIEPPAFTVEGELPEYHRNAAADERIVLAQPQAPRPITRAHTEYIFRSPRLELNLGEKKWPVKVPCYGWRDTVKGTVLVKDFKAVSRITVTVSLTHTLDSLQS
jgi:hypothetical protein